MVKIFIDAGHGGSDSGAVGNGLKEKDLTLTISRKIKDKLNDYENIQVKLSRESDQTLSLKQRTDMANSWGADYLVSVHINAFNGEANGYEDFIYTSTSAKTISYQNIMHEEIIKLVDFNNRGKKRGNLHMLRESKMPAILTESGFIDNVGDANKLKSDAYLDKIAQGHVNGIVRIFGLKKRADTKMESSTSSTWTSIEKIKTKGVMQGFPDGSFRADDPVTRGQLAVILDRLGLLD